MERELRGRRGRRGRRGKRGRRGRKQRKVGCRKKEEKEEKNKKKKKKKKKKKTIPTNAATFCESSSAFPPLRSSSENTWGRRIDRACPMLFCPAAKV